MAEVRVCVRATPMLPLAPTYPMPQVPEFRVSYTITTDAFDALYKRLKPKGVTMTALLAKAAGVALAGHPLLYACALLLRSSRHDDAAWGDCCMSCSPGRALRGVRFFLWAITTSRGWPLVALRGGAARTRSAGDRGCVDEMVSVWAALVQRKCATALVCTNVASAGMRGNRLEESLHGPAHAWR